MDECKQKKTNGKEMRSKSGPYHPSLVPLEENYVSNTPYTSLLAPVLPCVPFPSSFSHI